jgi:hypothetical protein
MKTNTYTVYLQVMLSVEVKATSMFAAEKLAQNLAVKTPDVFRHEPGKVLQPLAVEVCDVDVFDLEVQVDAVKLTEGTEPPVKLDLNPSPAPVLPAPSFFKRGSPCSCGATHLHGEACPVAES